MDACYDVRSRTKNCRTACNNIRDYELFASMYNSIPRGVTITPTTFDKRARRHASAIAPRLSEATTNERRANNTNGKYLCVSGTLTGLRNREEESSLERSCRKRARSFDPAAVYQLLLLPFGHRPRYEKNPGQRS
ncbi:uncharacterized protein LOC117226531 [Megalopta genalis]|uniref:uncharacterized protein LOC117226531 n=1 Tax=Megalopta genalis TaxID=115081 RepID=UPI003FD3E9C7